MMEQGSEIMAEKWKRATSEHDAVERRAGHGSWRAAAARLEFRRNLQVGRMAH